MPASIIHSPPEELIMFESHSMQISWRARRGKTKNSKKLVLLQWQQSLHSLVFTYPSIHPSIHILFNSIQVHVSHSAVTGNRHKVSAITSKNLFHIRKKSNISHQINPPQPNHTMQLVVWNETCSTFISFHLGLFSCTFHFNFHLPSMYPLWQLCTGKLY